MGVASSKADTVYSPNNFWILSIAWTLNQSKINVFGFLEKWIKTLKLRDNWLSNKMSIFLRFFPIDLQNLWTTENYFSCFQYVENNFLSRTHCFKGFVLSVKMEIHFFFLFFFLINFLHFCNHNFWSLRNFWSFFFSGSSRLEKGKGNFVGCTCIFYWLLIFIYLFFSKNDQNICFLIIFLFINSIFNYFCLNHVFEGC